MTYVVWSISPGVMKYDRLDENAKLLWHYFWNRAGRRSGPLNVVPEQCASDLGLSVNVIRQTAISLADTGLLMPIEELGGPNTGVSEPSEDICAVDRPKWLRWKIPAGVLSRDSLAAGPKLAYLYLWNKSGGRPGTVSLHPKEIAEFFNVPESDIL